MSHQEEEEDDDSSPGRMRVREVCVCVMRQEGQAGTRQHNYSKSKRLQPESSQLLGAQRAKEKKERVRGIDGACGRVLGAWGRVKNLNIITDLQYV